MLKRLRQTYLGVFREYPFLFPFAVVTFAGQAAFALVNIYALPVYLVQDLRLSGLTLGAASATFLCAETLLKFPMGRWSDRVGRNGFVVLGPLLICLNPTFFAALPTHLWFLVFPLRVADGAGAAALWPPLFAAVGDLVPDRSRAAAMSVMNTVYVAAIGGAVVVGAFAAHLTGSDRVPFLLASGFLIVTAVVAYSSLPRLPGTRLPAAAVGPAHGADNPAPAGISQVAAGGRLLVLTFVVSMVMSAGVLALSNFLVLYLKMDMGLSAGGIGALLAGLAVAVLALGLPLGHLADRWGASHAVRLSLTVAALAMWLIPSCRTMASFVPVAVILVLGHIMGTPAWLALVSQLAPAARRGGVMGLVATGEGVGAVVGPLLGGFLWDKAHHWVFYGSACLLTLAAALTLAALPRRRAANRYPW
jgi:MFS family permease